jgi:2',3'-cyclic-nucleotide 2'-phosphodiesterase (5'-nucleotidase family)
MRKSILKFTAIFCVLAILAVSCPVMAAGTPAEPATATSYVLPVFETSDVHGFLVNTASGSEASYAYRMAYIAGIVDSARTASGAASTLLLDGGDIYQGNAISNLLNGEPLTHAYCAMRYDAVALGNHEFDWGVTTLCDSDGTMSGYKASDGSWVDSTVPVLCGNLYEAGTTNRVNFTKDYIILDKTATALRRRGKAGKSSGHRLCRGLLVQHYDSENRTIYHR